MNTKKILFFSLVCLIAGFLSFSKTFGKEPLKIRVAIAKGSAQLSLFVAGSFEMVDVRTQASLLRANRLETSKISFVPEGLKLKNQIFFTEGVTILPKRKASLVVNNRSYRGDLSIIKEKDGTLLAVNILDLESYIKGVLYHEISHRWPLDAIKAQAVAARTYAVYQKELMKMKDYDLMADTSSQVYGGSSSEQQRTNRAVNFTYGEILTYRGHVFPTFFHATCGGTTENAVELWKVSEDIEPLQGSRVCSFCLNSPHYYWKASSDLKTIQKKLGDSYNLKSELKNISVAERNATGRVRSLELKTSEGETFIISAKDFRQLEGPDFIRSTNFSIVFEQDKVIFSGKGWGHGVGLCQWGALGMSLKGYNYKQILQFYYPGAEIVKIQ